MFKYVTLTIASWLSLWIERPGLPIPKEVICDSSKALLSAAVRSFAFCRTIDDYADMCMEEPMPLCFIRIDVAHFIKNYAVFLKDFRPKVKQFYLAVLGRLILCQDRIVAEEIFCGLVAVACSESEGSSKKGLSLCQSAKRNLMQSLTQSPGLPLNFDETDDHIVNDNSDCLDNIKINNWMKWAKSMYDNVLCNVKKEESESVNAYWCPSFIDRLLNDIKWYPLWSCISVSMFGYGKCPASSSHVEAEFKNIRHHMIDKKMVPMRVDEFITKHIESIQGSAKFKESALKEATGTSGEAENLHTKCPVCINGDMATGAHKCIICERNVHALEDCSLPLLGSEEGYGQQRICVACNEQSNKNEILEGREIENWGGLATPKKRKPSRYFRETYAENEFLISEKLKKIPQFRNGNDNKLKAVRFGDKRVDLSNTSTFDGIFHLFLTAAFDHAIFFEKLSEKLVNDSFFGLVIHTKKKGINTLSYKLRAEILFQIFETQSKLNAKCLFLPCNVGVVDLCEALFGNNPCFQKQTTCKRHKFISSINSAVMSASVGFLCGNEDLESVVKQQNTFCRQKRCRELQETHWKLQEPFAIFAITDERICLNDLPKSFRLPSMDRSYNLIGAIEACTPLSLEPEVSEQKNYVAISFRSGTWFSLSPKVKICSGSYKSKIELVIYVDIGENK